MIGSTMSERSLAITNIVHQIFLDSDNRVNLRGDASDDGME